MRGEAGLALLILASIALVLIAPVAGRLGHPIAANVIMALAAGGGAGAFVLVGLDTWRAARKRAPAHREDEP